MFVMTIDQHNSRHAPDAVPDLLGAVAHIATVLPFMRTVGDEVQGVLDSEDAVVDTCVTVARCGNWSIGIGVGEVETPLTTTSAEARGTAFVAARDAVEHATNAWVSLSVRSSAGTYSDPYVDAVIFDAQTVLRLLTDMVAQATDAQWIVTHALRSPVHATQTDIARRLGISQQAVSKAARAGRAYGIMEAATTAARLLTRLETGLASGV